MSTLSNYAPDAAESRLLTALNTAVVVTLGTSVPSVLTGTLFPAISTQLTDSISAAITSAGGTPPGSVGSLVLELTAGLSDAITAIYPTITATLAIDVIATIPGAVAAAQGSTFTVL